MPMPPRSPHASDPMPCTTGLVFPKWSGAAAIGGNFAKRVSETGQWWTIDQLVADADRCAAALEWTRFDPSRRQIVRGAQFSCARGLDRETLWGGRRDFLPGSQEVKWRDGNPLTNSAVPAPENGGSGS